MEQMSVHDQDMATKMATGWPVATGHPAIDDEGDANMAEKKPPAAGGRGRAAASGRVAKSAGGQTASGRQPEPAAPAVFGLVGSAKLAGEGIDPDEKTPRSFHLNKTVVERARSAVFYLAMTDANEPTTISELANEALDKEVSRLERKYNGGEPFPAMKGRARSGPGTQGAQRISDAHAARRRKKAEEEG
jgi:hypothetical protein